MADDREPYGRLFHEQGRLTVNAERVKPFAVEPWEKRSREQQELDMRGANAVAVQAVHDAGLEADRMRAQLLAVSIALPAALDALSAAVAGSEYEHQKRRYRAAWTALEALGGSEEGEAGHG